MTTSDFTWLIRICGEDIIEPCKGCEFNYTQSAEKIQDLEGA